MENDNKEKAKAEKPTWRGEMIKMLTLVGQLKRKGKFDVNSQYMRNPK